MRLQKASIVRFVSELCLRRGAPRGARRGAGVSGIGWKRGEPSRAARRGAARRGAAPYAPPHAQDDGRLVVNGAAARLGVDAQHADAAPDALEQVVEAPAVLGRDHDVVGHAVEQVELLDGDGVDLVHDVERGHVDAVALDHVDEVVHGAVGLPDRDVRVVQAVLGADGAHRGLVELGLREHGAVGHAALGLAHEVDVGARLVEADAEALELALDDALVRHGLARVEHDENHVAGARRADDLAAAALAVLGALDDAGQVEQLDARAAVVHGARDARQRRELVRGHGALRLAAGQHVEQSALADRGEADEADARVAVPRHVEAVARAARRALGAQHHLRLEARELGLEHAEVELGGLVLLRARHLRLQLRDLGERHLRPRQQKRARSFEPVTLAHPRRSNAATSLFRHVSLPRVNRGVAEAFA